MARPRPQIVALAGRLSVDAAVRRLLDSGHVRAPVYRERLDDALVDLDVDLPAGDYVTLAGLVLDRLGRLPAEGDQLELEGWRITVLSVRDRAIQQVRLDPLSPATDGND